MISNVKNQTKLCKFWKFVEIRGPGDEGSDEGLVAVLGRLACVALRRGFRDLVLVVRELDL